MVYNYSNMPSIVPQVRSGKVECMQSLPLPFQVERFFPKDPRLKERKTQQ